MSGAPPGPGDEDATRPWHGVDPGPWFDAALARHGNDPCVVEGATTTSYVGLRSQRDELDRVLDDHGVGVGDRVALSLGNSATYLAADLALLASRRTKVPLNQMLSRDEAAALVGQSGSGVLLCRPEDEISFLERLDGGRSHGEVVEGVTLIRTAAPVGEGGPRRFPAHPGAGDGADEAVVYYTGGTTGRSKGVVHLRHGVAANLVANVVEAEIASGERMAITTPLSHSAGLFALAGLLQGATIHLSDGFDASRFVARARAESTTWTFMVPTMIYRLLGWIDEHGDPGWNIRTIVYGAAPIAPPRLLRAVEVLGPILVQLYGQTECPNWGTVLTKADHRRMAERPELAGSCGRSATWARIGVMDGDEVRDVGTGEVCLAAPYLMAGYDDAPDLTGAARRGPWLRTGDIGSIGADGYLALVDRKADVIISGGMNVYSAEVEGVVATVAGVESTAVIGVPDDQWGEAVSAFVVLAAGADAEDTRAAVAATCRQLLATYKRPKAVAVVDELPLTPFGKVDKKALRQRFWAAHERQIS